MKHRKFNFAMASYIVVGIILCALVGDALAKYFQTSTKADTVKAAEFYFTSPILNGLNHELSPGATSVSFTVGNYEDDFRVSEVDITYNVVVSCYPESAPAPTITYNNGPTMQAGARSSQSVTLSKLKPGTKYTVTVNALGGHEASIPGSGYSKTLVCHFTVPANENAVYKYFQRVGEYVLLTVWAQGYTGSVTITPPAGVIPDNTDPVMAASLTGAEIVDAQSFTSNAYSSHTYRFFLNGASASADNFTVTYGTAQIAGYKEP